MVLPDPLGSCPATGRHDDSAFKGNYLIHCVFEMALDSDSHCFIQAMKVHVHCAGASFEDLVNKVGADNLPVELGGTLCGTLTAVFECRTTF